MTATATVTTAVTSRLALILLVIARANAAQADQYGAEEKPGYAREYHQIFGTRVAQQAA